MVKKILLVFMIFYIYTLNVYATSNNYMYSLECKSSFAKTVQQLKSSIVGNNLTIYNEHLHFEYALDEKIDIRPMAVIEFGDVKDITALIQLNQFLGFELPFKIMVWENSKGDVNIGFIKPTYMASKFGLSKNKIITSMYNLMIDIVITSAR